MKLKINMFLFALLGYCALISNVTYALPNISPEYIKQHIEQFQAAFTNKTNFFISIDGESCTINNIMVYHKPFLRALSSIFSSKYPPIPANYPCGVDGPVIVNDSEKYSDDILGLFELCDNHKFILSFTAYDQREGKSAALYQYGILSKDGSSSGHNILVFTVKDCFKD